MQTSTHRKFANRAIKWGFLTHRTGKRTRQAGLSVLGLGAAGAGVQAAASHLGSGGRWTDIDPLMHKAARYAPRLSRLRQIPAVAMVADRFGPALKNAVRHRGKQAVAWFRKSPKRIGRAQTVAAFGVRHGLARRGAKVALLGAGIGALGYGGEKLGGWLIRRGFGSHPGRLRRKVKYFFTGRV